MQAKSLNDRKYDYGQKDQVNDLQPATFNQIHMVR